MASADFRTTGESSCDVCGRTLLRGERAEIYLQGGARRSVCELCKPRAIHEGWVREGTVPQFAQDRPSNERRRSRLRTALGGSGAGARETISGMVGKARDRSASTRTREELREPRHVRAVPTSVEHKIASAVDVFNSSEHQRTVAGVGRSLGAPIVAARPSDDHPAVVNLTVSWELCWYRYEVDLSDEKPSVRVVEQGDEPAELPAQELQPNVGCDEHGALFARGRGVLN